MNLEQFVQKSLFQPEMSLDNSKQLNIWNKIGPSMNSLKGYSWNYSLEVDVVEASQLYQKLSQSFKANRFWEGSGGDRVREEVSRSKYILTMRYLGANLVSLNLFETDDIAVGKKL